jgi:transposase
MVAHNEIEFGKILALRERGFTIRKIAENTGIPKSTVGDFLKKYENTNSTKRKRGSGRQLLLGTRYLGLLKKIHQKNPKMEAPSINKKLREETSIIVCDQTVRNSLKKIGLAAYRPVKVPLLSEKNRLLRLEICTRWSHLEDEYWHRILYTDECKFNLFHADGNQIVWREPGMRLDPRYVETTVKHGGGNVMAWGCISSKGVGRLVFIEETMNKFLYSSILANNLRPSAELLGMSSFIFQQDNDPKHKSKFVTRFLEENGISVLEWPSQSPDLNPIEHVWAYMKRELRGKSFKNKNELKVHLLSLWENVPGELLKKIVDSMPRRIRAVLAANGKHTSY